MWAATWELRVRSWQNAIFQFFNSHQTFYTALRNLGSDNEFIIQTIRNLRTNARERVAKWCGNHQTAQNVPESNFQISYYFWEQSREHYNQREMAWTIIPCKSAIGKNVFTEFDIMWRSVRKWMCEMNRKCEGNRISLLCHRLWKGGKAKGCKIRLCITNAFSPRTPTFRLFLSLHFSCTNALLPFSSNN